jgi:hypothetical protein
MKHVLFFLVFNLLLVCAGSSQAKTEVLTNKSIVDMHKAGLGDDVIASSIVTSTCKFDVSTTGLIELKKQKISDEVIKNMIDKTANKPVAAKPSPEQPQPGNNPMAAVKVSTGMSIDLLNYVHAVSNNKARPLEKSTAGMRTKQGMFGGSAMWQIEGPAAAVRIAAGESSTFVINTGGALPEMVLYKVKSVKGRREVASMKVNSFSGVKTGEDVIPVDISKIKEGLYQLTPNKKLEKGEYFFAGKAIAGANSMDAFAFGID